MRTFSVVYPQFWDGKTGKQFRKMGAETQVIALYLITCRHAHMSGIYYLPKQTITYETGQTRKSVDLVLRRLTEAGFAFYDDESEFIWVKEMLFWQVKELKPDDHRVKGVVKWCNSLPNLTFTTQFRERYGPFLPGLKPLPSPFKGPSEDLPRGTQEGLPSPYIPVPDPDPSLISGKEGVGEKPKPVKAAKQKFGEHGNVLLTVSEQTKLIEKFGEQGAAHRIRDADLYIGSTGKKYESHYLTILNWERKHEDEGPKSKGNPNGRGRETPAEERSRKATEAANRVLSEYMAPAIPRDHKNAGK
jgi:hypothetical protein